MSMALLLKRPNFWLVSLRLVAVAYFGLWSVLSWLGSSRYPASWGRDAMTYYVASKALYSGTPELAYDPARLTVLLNQVFAGQLPFDFIYATFLYPPIFLDFIWPLSLLPFYVYYVALVIGTALIVAAAMGLRRGIRGAGEALACLGSPAGCVNVFTGQMSFLSLGLIVGGVRLLANRPILAGVLFGALSYKQQLGALVPVALVAARAWRAFAAAGATLAALAGLSVAVFGLLPWTAWFGFLQSPPADFFSQWYAHGVKNGFSSYVWALLLGGDLRTALTTQGIAILASAVAVFWTFRRSPCWRKRTVVLLLGTVFADPHLQAYELVMVTCAAMLFLGVNSPAWIARAVFAGSFFIWPIAFYPPVRSPFGYAFPLVLAALLALVTWSGTSRRASDAFAPGPVAGPD